MVRMHPSMLDNIQKLRRFFLGTAQKPDKALVHLARDHCMNDRNTVLNCLIKKKTKIAVQRPNIIITNKKTCTHHIIKYTIFYQTMRVLFHYTHKQTLGHTTRSIALATALCRHGAEVLVLQGGVPQPFIRFPKDCQILDIPFPFDDRTSFQAHAVPVSGAKRAQFILKTAADFCPDVFITEFFPFGRLAYLPELLPTLRYLRKKGTRIIASIGYPLLLELDRLRDPTFAALHRSLFALFDTFLIHTPEQLETPYIQQTIQSPDLSRLYAATMGELKKRIIYTGYVFPEKMITGGTKLPLIKNTASTIVISRGGGAVYPKLITRAIEAQRLLNAKTHTVNTIVACGPATSPKEMALFQSCLKSEDKGRVFLADHLDNLDDHLRTCSVSVSLCGYNTSVQLMRYATPSVIIPYQNSLSSASTNDQIARAQLLQERFSSTILDYNTMTAQSVADAIKKQMSSPRPSPAPAEWFNGADVAARFIVQDTAD
jgi:predicted glycosyltransferase